MLQTAVTHTSPWQHIWGQYRVLILLHCPSSSSGGEDDNWCPPLPARTYLMDASREELSSLPSKLPYAATLMSTPQRDTKVQVAGAIYHTSHWAEDLKGESLGKGLFTFSLQVKYIRFGHMLQKTEGGQRFTSYDLHLQFKKKKR